MRKFIFITGGVVSSLGKGISAASLGLLLKNQGFEVSLLKFDPYINVDSGTMNPFQHGEVFVTVDGAETDLDLGHYERFIDKDTSADNNVTTGKVYFSVIKKERRGDYLGNTVQVVPHITNSIKESLHHLMKKDNPDILIAEVGGTVGDIESLPFLEAIRQFRLDLKRQDVLYIHLTLVPYLETIGELKTKPTQHSVNELRRIGIQPDIIMCRSEIDLPKEMLEKISLFCNVPPDYVIPIPDVNTTYSVPIVLTKRNLEKRVMDLLDIKPKDTSNQVLNDWKGFVHRLVEPKGEITVGIVGKYTNIVDSYKSINQSIIHAAANFELKANIKWIESESLEKKDFEKDLEGIQGILVPGGFGLRGIEGKINAVQYAREKNIPFLGICLGMQAAVIEYARNVCGLKDADSTEWDEKTKNPVIDIQETQKEVDKKGGTMRLGSFPCKLKKNSLAYKLYGTNLILERHRHRFEFNNNYMNTFTENGLIISGTCPKNNLVEIVELKEHPFFIGCQFHPEFQSRPLTPHPLFLGFIEAMKNVNR
ncbi:MAG: CTP synthase [bacterium]|nr:CTP synthase [bacterium]